MTARDRIILLSAVLLALCVVTTAVLTFLGSFREDGVNTESLLFMGLIILAGILSVVVVYFTKIRKSKYEQLLNSEYYREYEVIRDAVNNSQLSGNQRREIIEDILDLLITSQKSGKTSKEVVGNPATFAAEIIKSFDKPGRLAVLSFLDGILAFVLFTMGASIFLWLEQTNKSLFEIEIDIAMIGFFFVVAFALLPLTKKQTSKQNPWLFMLPLAFGILFVCSAKILREYFYGRELVRWFLDGTVSMIPSMAVLVGYLLSIPAFLMLKVRIRKQCRY